MIFFLCILLLFYLHMFAEHEKMKSILTVFTELYFSFNQINKSFVELRADQS